MELLANLRPGRQPTHRESCPKAEAWSADGRVPDVRWGRRRPSNAREMASPSVPSWNQVFGWLRDMAALRESGIAAA